MQKMPIHSLGPLIEEKFDAMRPPGGGDGLVILKQVELQEHRIGFGMTGDHCEVLWQKSLGSTKTRRLTIDRKSYDQLRQLLPHDASSWEAVWAEEFLDGEAYLVQLVETGSLRRLFLGNPRLCNDPQLTKLADVLDRILNRGPSVIPSGKYAGSRRIREAVTKLFT